LDQHLIIAISAAIEAGKEIINVYNGEFDVELKEDASPLTIADKKANHIINQYLVKTAIPIISEENAQIDYKIRKDWNICWIVDPLDGTKEFIKRNDEFTVNIALVDSGKPMLGVIFVPVSKELYFADVKKMETRYVRLSTFEDSIEDIIQSSIKIGKYKNPMDEVRVVGSRSHMNKETADFVEGLKKEYKKVEIITKGSSLKFCLVAMGKADIYPRFAPTMEWDTAAAQAICEALGIKVISQETNDSLLYNKENLLNPWFLVSR